MTKVSMSLQREVVRYSSVITGGGDDRLVKARHSYCSDCTGNSGHICGCNFQPVIRVWRRENVPFALGPGPHPSRAKQRGHSLPAGNARRKFRSLGRVSRTPTEPNGCAWRYKSSARRRCTQVLDGKSRPRYVKCITIQRLLPLPLHLGDNQISERTFNHVLMVSVSGCHHLRVAGNKEAPSIGKPKTLSMPSKLPRIRRRK